MAVAVALLEREPTYIPGVGRSRDGMGSPQRLQPRARDGCGVTPTFLGLPSVTAEAAGRVTQAFSWYESGFDFADALHLAAASEAGAESIATFDESFRRLAGRQAVRSIGWPCRPRAGAGGSPAVPCP